MRKIFFVKAILCMALFFGYANIWGMAEKEDKTQRTVEKTPEPTRKPLTKGVVVEKTLEQPETQHFRTVEPQPAPISPRVVPGTAPAVVIKIPPKPVATGPRPIEKVIAAGQDVAKSLGGLTEAAKKAQEEEAFKSEAARLGQLGEAAEAEEKVKRETASDEDLSGTAKAAKAALEYIQKLHEEDFAGAAAKKEAEDAAAKKAQEEKEPDFNAELGKIAGTINKAAKLMRDLKPEELPQTTKVPTQLTPGEGTTTEKQKSFLQRNKKILAVGGGMGVGILALGGILAAILSATSSQDSTAIIPLGPIPPAPTPEPDIQPTPEPDIQPTPEPDIQPTPEPDIQPTPEPDIQSDIGIVTPSPYPNADKEDKNHEQAVESVASFYTDIEEKFEKALKESSYFDQIFAIEGEGKIGEATEKICIEYDFIKGAAGELGSPFTPCLVTVLPQGINGVSLNPDEIKNLLPKGPTRELFTTLIKPNAAFIFMIKIILLINTTLRNKSKKDVDKISFIIDEATKLYSRLILTTSQNPKPDAIIAKMPKTFQQIIAGISLKMFGDLVQNINDPESTVLIKRIGELQKKKDYLEITKFIKKEITPAIKKDMTHTEKKLLIYSLENILADSTKTGRDLWNHLDQLKLILTDIKKGMVKAKIDKETVAKIEDLLKKIQDVKAGIKKTTVLTKKPELEISTEIYDKNVSLKNVLKILFKNFSKIYYAKFKGDKGYSDSDILLGKNATKYALQSIFFRCFREMLQANQILSAAKGTVALRTATGKKSTINPDKEFSKICNESSLKFVQAQTMLKDAILKLRANPNDVQLKESYEKALKDINSVSKELFADQIEFRRTFAVYLPFKQADKSTQTPAELIQKRLSTLRKNSKHVDSIIASEYLPFSNALGLSPSFLEIK